MAHGILVTTSRRPPPRTRSLVKDIVDVIPRSVRLTRGHMSMEELWVKARTLGLERVMVVSSRRGNPSLIRIYSVGALGLENIVSLRLLGVSLAREYGAPSPSRASRMARDLAVYAEEAEGVISRVAEMLLRGLGARIALELEHSSNVVARVGRPPRDREGVLVQFYFGGRQVGPRLRVLPTRSGVEQR